MDTSQFQSPAGRRLMTQPQAGSGGNVARTVAPSDMLRTVGSIGMNVETSPIVVHDDEGRMVAYPKQDGTYRPAHFEVLHSVRRDPDIYPDANSFRLKFSKPLWYVFAIEVLEINVPNAVVDPLHREFLLLNGTFNETTGKFHPQEAIPKDRSFHSMMTHNANDPGVLRSAASDAAVDIFPYDDYALGRFRYDSTAPFQWWNRTGWHRKTWFPTPIARLDFLDFALTDAEGNRYDLPADEEWSATLQIFAKA